MALETRKRRGRRPSPDAEMDLMEHLDELRARLLRSVGYLAVTGVFAWYLVYDRIFAGMTAPLVHVVTRVNPQAQFIFTSFTEPFFLKLKVCAILAMCLASPLLLWEVWGFVSPGLTPDERKPFKIVFPMAVVLFAMGASLSYYILPAAFAWFLSYMPADVALMQHVSTYMLFVVKMCAAFGLGFELPVVLMFAGKIGLLNHRTMKQYWRQAVVVIMIVAAIITPSNDPFSMMMMATPMAILYLGSIRLVKWVEPKYEVQPYEAEEKVATRRPADPDDED